MRPPRAGATVLAAAALALAAVPAGADEDPKSKVKIKKLKPSGAGGVVRSKDDRCESKRKVRFFRIDDFISVKVQFTRTNSKGKWRIERDLEPGRYFAKVDGTRKCRYDVSRTERLR